MRMCGLEMLRQFQEAFQAQEKQVSVIRHHILENLFLSCRHGSRRLQGALRHARRLLFTADTSPGLTPLRAEYMVHFPEAAGFRRLFWSGFSPKTRLLAIGSEGWKSGSFTLSIPLRAPLLVRSSPCPRL